MSNNLLMSISFENLLRIHPGGVTSKKAMGLPIIFKTINLCIRLEPLISVRRSPAPWKFNQ